eukprot:g1750.t1
MILLPPVALATFAYHYGFVLLIQVENYVTNHALLGSGLWGVVRLLANMAFWQLEPLLFALGLGMLSVILGVHQNTYRASWKGKAFFGVMVGCNAWLVMDQIVFKVLADHAKLSMSDQGLADAAILSKVAGSALAEVDLVAVANFVLLVVASRWLYQVYFHSRVPFFLRAAGSSGGSGGSSSSSSSSSSGSASARLHEVAAVRAVRVINRGLGALVLASLLACGVFGCMDDNSQVILERHAISAFLGDMLFVADRSDDAGWLATLFGGASAGRGRGGLRGVGGRRGMGGSSPLSKNTAGANAVFRMRFGTAPGRPSTAFVDAAMERKEAAPAAPGVDLEGLHLDPLDSATGNGAGGDRKPVADAVDAWVQSLIETRRRRSSGSSSSSGGGGGGGKNKGRLPNVVFFVLESVGSKQVLPGRGGVADPSVTPNVAALQNMPGSVTFRNVYNTFPSTTRTHLPAATGGITGTQGGIVAQLKNVYNGSTLVGRLRGLGYRTALFAASDLGFESLDTFLFNQGYDKFHHFGSASDAFKKDHYLNSWGGDDHSMVSEGLRWVGEQQQQQQQQQQDNGDPGGGGGGGDNDADDDGNGDADRPWAMHFLSDATHHPYSVPQGYPKQFSGGDGRLDGYHNSMYYTDECVGKLIAGLKEAGVWEDTLFVLSGDHGEAFGAAGGDHARNYLHKNFLYEENVRTFLMLHDPNVRQGGGGDRPLVPLISERVASVGDIFPTIVAAATASDASATHEPEDVLRRVLGSGSGGGGGGRRNRNQRPLDIPGRSLIASDWEARAVFFHKTSAPIQWGLRDGPFKFIANQVGSHAEIYDLRADPRERYNLVVTKARQDQTGGGDGGDAAAAASTVSSSGGYKPPADPWGELTAADGVEAMVEAYHGMAEDWFLDVHCRFMRQLNGYKHGGSCFEEEEEEEEEDGGGGGGSDEKEHGDNSNNEKNKAADGKADAKKNNKKNNKKKHHKKVTMRQAGPKKGAFGYKDGGGEFHELPWVPERASSVCFFTEWLPYDTSQRVLLDFAPVELHRGLQRANDPTPAVSQEMVVERRLSAEQRQVFEWTIEPAWHTTWWYFHMTAPLTAGKWEVIVWAGDDTTDGTRGSRLLVSQLLVKPSLPQPLPEGLSLFSADEASGKPVSKRCRLTTRRVTPGFSAQNGTFYPATTFHPDQHWVSFEVKWQVCNSKRSITYRTADPSNEVYSFKQEVKGGWHTTVRRGGGGGGGGSRVWYHGAFNKPMKQSAWFITVWDDGSSRLVGSASFVVDAKAPILA